MEFGRNLFWQFILGKNLYAIVGFIILVAAGGYLIVQLIAQRSTKVILLVAKGDYPKGTSIKEPKEMFEFFEIFLRDAPIGFITDFGELQDQTLTKDLRKAEPVQMMFLQISGTKPKQEYG